MRSSARPLAQSCLHTADDSLLAQIKSNQLCFRLGHRAVCARGRQQPDANFDGRGRSVTDWVSHNKRQGGSASRLRNERQIDRASRDSKGHKSRCASRKRRRVEQQPHARALSPAGKRVRAKLAQSRRFCVQTLGCENTSKPVKRAIFEEVYNASAMFFTSAFYGENRLYVVIFTAHEGEDVAKFSARRKYACKYLTCPAAEGNCIFSNINSEWEFLHKSCCIQGA